MIFLIRNIKSPNEEHITKAPLIQVDVGQRCNEIMKAQRTQKNALRFECKGEKWIIGLLALPTKARILCLDSLQSIVV